ncbi:hypothetical protein TPHA_0O00640 [Tetrapisispora phaffii CBS 4417]|uniref:NAD-dependent epimerase/dehydratase domain-containing protein n=1 Tax=Tetrapisispora phaffii (strain ATCC 24235 / CBS 4417 / NBRC 1672 / NRRL Y-8282 / UCD 70-5) TaxID=1071381 RepID=G8C1K6_TETPH|nr:hypothetical protein TPHA_0O00640 [Tetrapisispora phaffii CBS 4417]CCE66034.1 hypothetical protein TPHA_0O00640 [Tetrapisispora phaffii CBS 4417]
MAVLVTGASGFIALHVINLLLSQNYKVIGTVRSQDKVDKIIKQFNNPNLSFELVTDITKLDAFDETLKKHSNEIDYVIHMASPLPDEGNTDFENHYLLPAVNGTKSVLSAIKKFAPKGVKHVVMTSSIVAMLNVNDDSAITTEKDWNPITWEQAKTSSFLCYFGSKTYSEKAAWDFLKENKDEVDFKFTTVNPVMVFGRQMFDEDVKDTLNVSCEYVNKILYLPPTEKLSQDYAMSYVHVDDVALAHVMAMREDRLDGERLLLSAGTYSDQLVANSINKQFPQVKGTIPAAIENCDKLMIRYDSIATQKQLGIEWKSFDVAVYDIAHQALKRLGKL